MIDQVEYWQEKFRRACLDALSSEGEWIEHTGKLNAEIKQLKFDLKRLTNLITKYGQHLPDCDRKNEETVGIMQHECCSCDWCIEKDIILTFIVGRYDDDNKPIG